MPARDMMHDAVRDALIRAGWTITHDPYTLQFGARDLYVDLGAEQTLAAEREEERIAVEVKSFIGQSEIRDFELALGQFVLYRSMMKGIDPKRQLFLAFPEDIYRSVLSHADGERLISELRLAFFTLGPQGEIARWHP
jgi:hypothetical protein